MFKGYQQTSLRLNKLWLQKVENSYDYKNKNVG